MPKDIKTDTTKAPLITTPARIDMNALNEITEIMAKAGVKSDLVPDSSMTAFPKEATQKMEELQREQDKTKKDSGMSR